MTTEPPSPVSILIAEDNSYDRMILEEVFTEMGLQADLHFVKHGEELLDYLHSRGTHADPLGAANPMVILMDLNMPRMNGNEALRRIRADDKLRVLPVLILSTSNNPKQIAQAYANGANAFLTKPGEFDAYVAMFRSFRSFWLDHATLPFATPG